ncbi:Pentatricopeptide repeat-containing protein [Camellia lanceoleosa]|uniref:Pentatricopeptide repeat-containing protein n=1 Tax=Camellia lanceoleosa TaxID=1840588 RepID=A0ACC0F428_9ERIC|nr:Pentatricopeptide repeat-containing protein [Camellia lanceoleosa]
MLYYPSSHNHFTFTHALKACSSLSALRKGLEIHARVIKTGHFSDIFIQNSLIHFYVLENHIVNACRVFYAILYPDIVSWTSIVSGLSKRGFESEAIVKFLSMDIEPNATTLVSVISACSSIRAVKLGKAIHGYCLKNLTEDNIILDNAVLDFYVKCGSVRSAHYRFERMTKRDIVSWTAMVGGFAHTGLCEEAVGIFQDMLLRRKLNLLEATIVNVLSASCSHGRMIDQGLMFFKAMTDVYRIEPQVQHYACIVDMYGRAGLLKEAEAFIKKCLWKQMEQFGEHSLMLAEFMGMRRCLGESSVVFLPLKV